MQTYVQDILQSQIEAIASQAVVNNPFGAEMIDQVIQNTSSINTLTSKLTAMLNSFSFVTAMLSQPCAIFNLWASSNLTVGAFSTASLRYLQSSVDAELKRANPYLALWGIQNGDITVTTAASAPYQIMFKFETSFFNRLNNSDTLKTFFNVTSGDSVAAHFGFYLDIQWTYCTQCATASTISGGPALSDDGTSVQPAYSAATIRPLYAPYPQQNGGTLDTNIAHAKTTTNIRNFTNSTSSPTQNSGITPWFKSTSAAGMTVQLNTQLEITIRLVQAHSTGIPV